MSVQVHNEQASEVTQAPAGEASGEAGAAQGETATGAAEAGATEGDSPSGEGKEAAESGEKAEGEGEAPAAPAYKPRDKFKVRVFNPEKVDELVQKEESVPEFLKPLMKDAESEKQVMDLLERAYGIDSVKGERAHVKKERDHFRNEFTKIQGSVAELRTIYQRGDLDLFLDKLSIPHERMLQWALDKVNYSQLPPEQQRVIDERRDAQRKAYAAEQRMGTYEAQLYEQQRQAKSMLLDAGLARPEVSTFAAAFDAKVGKPGAFRLEVAAVGEQAWNQSEGKVDLTPEQAIEQAMTKWKPFIGEAQAAQAPTAAAAGSQSGAGTKPTTTAKPAVIPNVQGRPSSPMKSKPRSIEDLKKLAKDASAS